jgi:disulfide bond formation protein DsbB
MTLFRFAPLWPAAAALVAAAMLAAAHAFETFGGYPPCELCLYQRDVYWVILWSGGALALLTRARPSALLVACAALGVLFLAESALGGYHAGVEWKWWPGPARCTGLSSHPVTAQDMTNLLSGKTTHIVQCDVAAWRLLGLSMAGWNALAALAFAGVSLFFARPWRPSHARA